MSKVIPSLTLAAVLSTGFINSVPAFGAETVSAKKPLVSALQQQINFASVEGMYNRALLNEGSIESMVAGLQAFANDKKQSKGARSKALHTLSLIRWREGQMKEALESVDQGLKLMANADLTLQKARLLDATGKFEEALSWYQKAMPMLVGSEREQIQVRVTLMEAEGNVEPLVKLAKSKGNGFRNRAAVALAILGHEPEAIELYRVDANAKQSERFRQRIRLADWSIRADNPARAQQEAWEAVQLAKLKRDRRYALALLVESHRMNDSIDELIARMGNQKTLTEDARSVWVELLRETGEYGQAIAAFKETSEDWTSNLKRQLISLYKEANNDEAMEKEFAQLIAAEPREVSWPQGLAEHYLEKGRRADAVQVWEAFIDRNDRSGDLLAGAAAMVQLGLDDQAIAAAEKVQRTPKDYSLGGFLLFELYLTRGRLEEAEQTLLAIDKQLPAASLDRRDLADGFERIQQPEKALETLKGLYDNGVELGVDGEMRIAWLQQSLGKNEEALASWYAMLEKTPDSQRRLVEDRILLLSAELGRLGKMAVALEEKILDKTADEKDARMLIKIYSKAGDAGSAVEIIEEYFGEGTENAETVASLREKGLIFQFLGDYQAYEKVTQQLLAADTEHQLEHVRSLILNHIENAVVNRAEGGEEKLQTLIDQHNQLSDGEAAREFEAGVLELSGDFKRAAQTYRLALAENPERGDNYLVMANLMVELNQVDEAVRMFQYLAERAERDDLFVIAMDGLLNMQSNDPNVMKWAQRITLERLTSKSDKSYYYSLLSDLADDGGNTDLQLAALENSLSHANSRRAVTLRELIVLTDPAVGRFGSKSKKPDIQENLKYSRRLIALRQEFPPEVFINMGKTFLSANEPDNALKAFNMAVDATGRQELMTEAAAQFEKKNFDRQALTQYEKALIANSGDLRIMWRLGELKERAGWNDAANQLYSEGIQGVLSRHAIVVKESDTSLKTLVNSALDIPADIRQDPGKTDEYKRSYLPLRDGFARTLSADQVARDKQLSWYWDLFNSELNKVDEAGDDAHSALAHYPRLGVTSQFLRFIGLSNGYYDMADRVDTQLLKRFPEDEALGKTIVAVRNEWGQVDYDSVIAGYDLPKAARDSLQQSWSELSDIDIKPLLTVKRGKSRSLWGSRQGSDNKALLDLKFNLALLADDQDQLLDVCREMVKEGMFSQAINKGRGSLSDSHFKRLCSYTAQRISGSKKEFERALVRSSGRFGGFGFFVSGDAAAKSWLDIVEESIGEPIFDESELMTLVKGVDDLKRLNAAYVFSHLTGRNRESFLNMIGPVVEENKRLLGSLLAPELARPIPPSEQAIWLEIADKYGRAYDGFEGMGAAEFLERAEIAPENGDLARKLAQIVAPKSQQQEEGQLTSLDLKLDIATGDYAKAMDTAIGLILSDGHVPAFFRSNRGRAGMDTGRFVSEFIYLRFDELFAGRQRQAMAALDKAARNDSDAEKLLQIRMALLQNYLRDEPDALLAELEKLSRAYPENTAVLVNLNEQYGQQGYTYKSIGVLQQLVKLVPQNPRYQQQLQSAWNQLDHPVNALEVSKNAAQLPNRRGMFGGRDPAADPMKQVKKARDSKDDEKLRAVMRKFWQQVAASEGKVEWSMGDGFSLNMQSFLAMKWPAESGEEEEAPSQAAAMVMMMGFGGQPEEDDGRPTVIEKISDYPFSVAEFETWVATMRADQIDAAWPVYQALARAYQNHGDIQSRANQLKTEINKGLAGDKEVALWLALLEADSKLVDDAAMATLRGKVSGIGTLRKAQLMAMAHIYARAGAMRDALNGYRSLANAVLVIDSNDGFRFGGGQATTATSLLDDARQELEKSYYYDFLNGVLKLTYPPVGSNLESHYADFVIWVLQKELDSADVKERFGGLLERNVKVTEQWQLEQAVDAAYVQQRMGLGQQALATLREALTPVPQQLTPMRMMMGNNSAQGYQQMLGVARQAGGMRFLRSQMAMVGISVPDDSEDTPSAFSKLVPMQDDSWPGADRWVNQIADQLPAWLKDSELDTDRVLELTGVVMESLSSSGDLSRARQVSRLATSVLAAGGRFSETAASGIIASADRAGTPIDLSVSQQLLKAGRLKVDQVVAVLQRTLEQQGPRKALALGQPVTEFSLNDNLLSVLVLAAEQAGRPRDVQSFEKMKQEAETARQELDAEQKLRLSQL